MKRILKVVFTVAFVAFTGYNVYSSQSSKAMSDMLLENVEAFGYINPEIEDFSGFYLKQYPGGCAICRRGGETCNVHDQVPC